jgi:predicted transcriptional regulator
MSNPSKKAFTRRQAEIISLRAEGLSHKEIGCRLGLTAGTVKVCISRAASSVKSDPRQLVIEYIRRERIDYMRVKALELSAWLREYGEPLEPNARAAMEQIIAHMVDTVLPSLRASECEKIDADDLSDIEADAFGLIPS